MAIGRLINYHEKAKPKDKDQSVQTLKRVLIISAALYFGITLLIITPALNFLPAWYVNKEYGRTLDTGFVLLNPFKLSLDITRAELSEADGSRKFAAIGATSINLSSSSLWRPGIVLDELKVHELYVRVVRHNESTFNFSDLIPADSAEPEPEEESGVPGVTIENVDIQAQTLAVRDEARKTPVESEWSGLKLQVTELSTVLEDGKPYTLHMQGPNGGTLDWQGTISLPLAQSTGTLVLTDLHLRSLWELAEPWLAFEVSEGLLYIRGEYHVDWDDPLVFAISNAQAGVNSLAIAPQDTTALPETALRLAALDITGINAASTEEHAQVDALAISGLVVDGWSEGSRVSLVDMFTGLSPAPSGDIDADDAALVVQPPDPNMPGEVILPAGDDTVLETAATDDRESNPATVEQPTVSPDAAADENGNDQDTDLALSATTPEESAPADPGPAQDPNAPGMTTATAAQSQDSSADAAAVATGPTDASPQEPHTGWTASLGRLAVADSSVNWRSEFTEPARIFATPISVEIDNINWPLAGDSGVSFSTKLNDIASIALDGNVDLGSGSGQVNYVVNALPLAWFDPILPEALHAHISSGALGIRGAVDVGDFAPSNLTLDGGITDFEVSMQGVEDSLTGWEELKLDSLDVSITEQFVQLTEVELRGYYGRLHIYEDGSINASSVWQEELAKGAAGGEGAAASNSEVADESGAELQTDALDSAADEEETASEDNAEALESPPWTFDVATISVYDSQVDFMDQSLPIPFRTLIGDVNGAVTDLDNTDPAPAEVEINGSVDGYAPVSLTGTVSPFADELSLDLALTFTGVDMALLSPYSSTYAGYRIDSGILDLNLQYALDGDRLKGNNEVRLDQLQLGEKVESEQAVDAPLELAIAILTDASGVIDLEVPVSGNVDDPSFELGSVIVKAFFGLITKAVTAPFNMLANLVGTEEDLRLITFPVGSAEPDPAARSKLDSIAQALQQRPKIRLAVMGQTNVEADRARLQKTRLDAQIIESGVSAESVKTRDDVYQSAIEERFRALAGATDEAEAPTGREMRERVATSITVTDEELLELAMARGGAVKAYLVNEQGIPADHIVLRQSSLESDEARFSGASLDIK